MNYHKGEWSSVTYGVSWNTKWEPETAILYGVFRQYTVTLGLHTIRRQKEVHIAWCEVHRCSRWPTNTNHKFWTATNSGTGKTLHSLQDNCKAANSHAKFNTCNLREKLHVCVTKSSHADKFVSGRQYQTYTS